MLCYRATAAVVFAWVFLLVGVPASADDSSLLAAARKEGEVVWYTTQIVDQLARPMVAAFERKYPGRAGPATAWERDWVPKEVHQAALTDMDASASRTRGERDVPNGRPQHE